MIVVQDNLAQIYFVGISSYNNTVLFFRVCCALSEGRE